MRRSNHSFGRIVLTIVTVAGLFAGVATTGCDDYSGYIQDSYEYQQSVFDAANDAWDDYIRM